MKSLLWSLIMILVVLIPAPAYAGQIKVRQLTMKAYPDVQAYVSILDDQGQPWRGALTKENFRIFENGKMLGPLDSLGSAETAIPLTLLFVIDVSGSMKYPSIRPDGTPDAVSKLDAAKAATSVFIGNMRPDDHIAVAPFNTNIPEVSAIVFSQDRQALTDQTNQLQPTANTALYSAITRALEALAGQAGRTAIVLLTDGRNDVKPGEPANLLRDDRLGEVTEKLAAAQLPVYVIGLGNPQANNDQGLNEPVLQQIAAVSHGSYYRAPDGAQLQNIYASVQEEFVNQAQLNFRSAAGRSELLNPLTYKIEFLPWNAAADYKINFSGPVSLPSAGAKDKPLEAARRNGFFAIACLTIIGLMLLPTGAFYLRRFMAEPDDRSDPPQGGNRDPRNVSSTPTGQYDLSKGYMPRRTEFDP